MMNLLRRHAYWRGKLGRARRRQLGERGESPGCTGEQQDTLPAALVAPDGYRGYEARICKCGGLRHYHTALSHQEVKHGSGSRR